jgi:GDP-4-dehydro-6-deoxy-D-mannose reductase
MRILVTGGYGFVGQHLLTQLESVLTTDDFVVVASRRPSKNLVASSAQFFPVDITDRTALKRLVTEVKPTHTLHLAALSSVSEASRAPAIAWQVNAVGSLNLAQVLSEEAQGSTLLLTSSAEVYGRAFISGEPITEYAELVPQTAYARSKMAAEAGVLDIMAGHGRVVILRPFNHTGPGQDERFVVPAFAAQVARIERGLIEPVLYVGNLTAERDFLHVDDVVRAYISLLLASANLPERSVFNIASGEAHQVATILNILRVAAFRDFAVLPNPALQRPAEISKIVGSAEMLRTKTGWQPTISWEKTINTVLDDWRQRVASFSCNEKGEAA